ncbi:MAG: alanine dehydrogenase, partial [Planctomycetes bacterium]|nr:alanine dehydrogenase [Planctomycetota bacterium]
MIIGLPKEVQDHEYRVALTPAGVRELVAVGAEALVETVAGAGSGFEDAAYSAAGAKVVRTAAEVWSAADLVVKVKEPVK